MRPQQPSLKTLWQSASATDRILRPENLIDLSDPARGYLKYAIAPGTQLTSAVRLRIHGEIKRKQWHPFRAEQVICWQRGMIWQATAWMNGLPIRGWDRLVECTIPTRVRAGWYFGTGQFEPVGEFFRATIDQATYR